MSANRPTSKFSFLDEGEAIRRLGVDRDTLLTFVREKRLRAYPGVGKGSFFRVSDLDTLAKELGLAPPPPATAPAGGATLLAPGAITVRKGHDPAYKVHLRLQADLKWFDITQADLVAWVRELHPDAYRRQRGNIDAVVATLERLRGMMDEAAAHWKNLPPEAASEDASEAKDADQNGSSDGD